LVWQGSTPDNNEELRPFLLREEAAMKSFSRQLTVYVTFFYWVALLPGIVRAAGQEKENTANALVSQDVNRGEKVKTEGLVISRQGDLVTMRTSDSTNVVVALTDYTKVVTPRPLFRKKHMPVSDLAPGLWIKVKGVGDSPGHILAESVSFSADDLRTAQAIQAGLTPLDVRVESNQHQIQTNLQSIQANQQQLQTQEQQIQANQQRAQVNQQQIGEANQRISELADYTVTYSVAVSFPVGSAILSTQARNELMRLAEDAVTLKGYVVQIKGFTDSSGGAALNQGLSMRRAQSVIAYLEQAGNIPLTHVLTPGAMGESHPVSSNLTVEGRAENRRVEIKVLVSRGIAGP
jgi:outer membrane protein OmpA-like peptidoglycan-associated protein